MASFQGALDSIKAGIKDMAELNVKTFTGDIQISASGVKDLDIDGVLAQLGSNVAIEVVAITDMKLDGDITQFITSKDVPAGTLQAHTKAVETGRATRQAMVDLFADKAKTLIKNLS